MTKQTLLCIAAFAAAIATTAKKLTEDSGEEQAANTPETPATPGRRGRKPAEPAAPPAEPETPATQGMTEAALRELIAPLVESGKGTEVKKLIAKHGGTKLNDLPAAAHAAFARDVEALTI